MAGEALDANAAQRRYWNTVAGPRWVATPGFRERRNQESLALLLARLGLAGGESVLEIGCRTGALTQPLAKAVGEHGRVVAVDISEPMLVAARQRIAEHGEHDRGEPPVDGAGGFASVCGVVFFAPIGPEAAQTDFSAPHLRQATSSEDRVRLGEAACAVLARRISRPPR